MAVHMQYNKSYQTRGDKTMKVTTKIQAERIAKAGSFKMDGYTFRPHAGSEHAGKVVKPNGQFYRVNVKASTCNCKFYQENFRFQACKHIAFAKAEIEWTARVNEEAAAREEYEAFGKYV